MDVRRSDNKICRSALFVMGSNSSSNLACQGFTPAVDDDDDLPPLMRELPSKTSSSRESAKAEKSDSLLLLVVDADTDKADVVDDSGDSSVGGDVNDDGPDRKGRILD